MYDMVRVLRSFADRRNLGRASLRTAGRTGGVRAGIVWPSGKLYRVPDFDFGRSGTGALGSDDRVEACGFYLGKLRLGVSFLGICADLHLIHTTNSLDDSLEALRFQLCHLRLGVSLLEVCASLYVVKRSSGVSSATSGSGTAVAATSEQRVDPAREFSVSGVQPVAGAALVCKPAVRRQHHFVAFRGIRKSFLLAAEPEHLRFAIALADVGAELDQLLIYSVIHGIWRSFVTCALDRDRSLVVRITGAAPAPVALVHDQTHASVLANSGAILKKWTAKSERWYNNKKRRETHGKHQVYRGIQAKHSKLV